MFHIRRRRILLSAGALLAAPLASFTQQSRGVRRIGLLSLDSPNSATGQQQQRLLRDSLRRVGYEEGKNLGIEWRFAEGKVERLASLADELVRLKVDLILVPASTEATRAAKNATRTIPIVMQNLFHPVEFGIIESLARPGGNVTGTTYAPIETIEKQYQILKEAAPAVTRVATLVDPTSTGNLKLDQIYASQFERIAAKMGMTLEPFEVSRPEDIAAALQRIAAFRPDALYISTAPVIRARFREIVAFTIERRLISMGTALSYVNAGGLLYYGPDIPEMWNVAASYVDRILNGAKPADLPAEEPRKYELVFNASTARAIGYKIPLSLQLRVDRVIE